MSNLFKQSNNFLYRLYTMKKYTNNETLAIRISIVTIILNAVLFGIKLFGGISSNSLAMLSDAANSASDFLATIIVIAGIKMAARVEDADHEFGHERYECVAAILLSAIVFATGIGVGYGGVKSIVDGNYGASVNVGALTLGIAIFSIILKEIMFWYTYVPAKKINSDALRADAWNHRSDALSSFGSLAGIVGVMCGVPILDSVASIVICLLILKAATDIFIDAVNKMTDKACDIKTEREIRELISSFDGVKNVDKLMTRLFGNRIYVVAEIACDANQTLYEAHAIAEEVHEGVEKNFPKVKHVTVHVNPYFIRNET